VAVALLSSIGKHPDVLKETAVSAISNKSPDPLDIALGVAIRVRRRMAGMSQEQLA
jgi:hypothetical protein